MSKLGRRLFISSGIMSEPLRLDPADPGTEVLRGCSGVRSRITSIFGVSGALISGCFISGGAPFCNLNQSLNNCRWMGQKYIVI